MQPEHVQLLLQLWERQRRAQARAGEEARRAERAAVQAAERGLAEVSVRVCVWGGSQHVWQHYQ